MFSDRDRHFMQLALKLAVRGRGFVSPNPMVGACLVKNGRLISSGYHECFGKAHAEVRAIHAAGKRAKNSSLYVTLEPCSTWGKTPPCTQLIIESGIKKVIVASLDPNPRHAGSGVRILRRAGIRVEVGLMREESRVLNRGFEKWIQSKLPFVTLKLAQSLDGKIATKQGDSRWVSGNAARKYVHVLRSQSDAVLVGKNTALRDNPLLSVRHVKSNWQPWRIVIDPKGELSPKSRLFSLNPTRGGKAIVVCESKHLRKISRHFQSVDVCLLPVNSKNGKIDLKFLLRKLGALGITSLLVEGGGELAASFLEKHLADELYLFVAPKIVGGKNAVTSFEGHGVKEMRDAKRIQNMSVEPIGDDYLLKGSLR